MLDYSAHSDQEVLEMLKAGDQLAFNEIYKRYSMQLFYQVNQMLRDEDTSKDIVQELFISLWDKSSNINLGANLAGYLYVAARNRVLKQIQKGKVRNDYVASIAKYATEVSTEMMDTIDEKQLSIIIEREISLLPPKMKEVFELSRKGNFSHKEIAEQLGISDKTVKKQVNKALKILRIKIGPHAPIALVILDQLHFKK